MTASIAPAFVAEARRHYVPAIRWARANGWDTPRLHSQYRDVEIHRDWVWNGHSYQPSFVVIRKFSTLREQFYPTSVKQAIDHLVIAEILPVKLASWATPDGIAETMRAQHMVAIDLRPEAVQS